jgi:6-phosphogluconate dehydrogenase
LRRAVAAAIDETAPVRVLGAALFGRFSSRREADFANRVLSAMRKRFGGFGGKNKGKNKGKN